MDIQKNIDKYIHGDGNSQGIKPLERYASFDYCYNYFQSFREQSRLSDLYSSENIQESCLQLGFYLASWGMLRGSSFLLGKSSKLYESIIKEIAYANPVLWEIDANSYNPHNVRLILDFKKTITKNLNYGSGPSDILVTKIMLGVFGNVPAFDTNFKSGFGVSTFGKRALEKIAIYYEINKEIIDKNRLPTLDFKTGLYTNRFYTRAKVIDMIFFIEGGNSSDRADEREEV